jgi:acetolactate synthase-1/2/3 large subunit
MARHGRPGPVLIDIPMDIQRAEIDEQQLLTLMNDVKDVDKTHAYVDIASLYNELLTANKPLVLLGGGAVNNDFFHPFIALLKELHIPYAGSLKGSEKIPEDAAYLGMIGSYGTRVANYAIQSCDFLLVIGSRLDVRQTGADCQDFARNARITQVDIDPHQLNNRITSVNALQMDARLFYQAFIKQRPTVDRTNEWVALLHDKKTFHYRNEYKDLKLGPFDIFDLINQKFRGQQVQFVCDVGNNQMWAAHTIQLDKDQKMHHSAGLGAMGFSIPSSLGVQMASNAPVVSFSGDGGAQLNIQELDVISREQLPILTIILNNKALGMVKNFQEMYFDGRDESTYWRNYSCNFVHIARGYNMESQRIDNITEFGIAIDAFLSNPRPLLLEIDIEFVNECRPRLSFGDKLDKQSPQLIDD